MGRKLKTMLATMLIGGTIITPSMAQESADAIIRVGEYENKPGKRVYVEKDLGIDLPLHKDSKGLYYHEYDMNMKLSKAIVDNLDARGINTKLQIANNANEDLNSAGRKAMNYNPKVYFSVHHNYIDNTNVGGRLFMYNQGNTREKEIAERLHNKLDETNSSIKSRDDIINKGSIGELNETGATINMLYEGGFFSNVQGDLQKIAEDTYIEDISKIIADELAEIIGEVE